MNPKIKSITTLMAFLLFLFLIVGCSSPPDDVIKAAINSKNHNKAFVVEGWNQKNAYTRTIDEETVYYIEYQADFKIKPEFANYVHSKGGISFPSDSFSSAGTVVMVKRGSEWYALDK